MILKTIIKAVLFSFFAAGIACAQTAGASSTAPVDDQTLNDPGYQAMEEAREKGTFLLVHVYKEKKESPVFDAFTALQNSQTDRVKPISIDVDDPDRSWLINTYNLNYAPAPLLLVLAPNGAITGSFPHPISEAQLMQSLVSPGTQACLLAFQQRKLVALCVQGEGTRDNEAAMKGVNDFSSDPSFGRMTQVVMLDPEDDKEKLLLKQIGLNTPPASALTYFIAPPGKLIGRWEGPTVKETLVATLTSALRSSRSCADPTCKDPSCPTPGDQPQAKQ